MTVAELIEYLKTLPQSLQVVYSLHSEHILLQPDDIDIQNLCEPRPDGWVHDARPDKPSRVYLTLP